MLKDMKKNAKHRNKPNSMSVAWKDPLFYVLKILRFIALQSE